jgi:hypothetical protein
VLEIFEPLLEHQPQPQERLRDWSGPRLCTGFLEDLAVSPAFTELPSTESLHWSENRTFLFGWPPSPMRRFRTFAENTIEPSESTVRRRSPPCQRTTAAIEKRTFARRFLRLRCDLPTQPLGMSGGADLTVKIKCLAQRLPGSRCIAESGG